jgi:hypothetical protein
MDNGMSLDQLEAGVQSMNGMDEGTLMAGAGMGAQPPMPLPQPMAQIPEPPTAEQWAKMSPVERQYTLGLQQLITTAAGTGMSQKAFYEAMNGLQLKKFEAEVKMIPPQVVNVTNKETGFVQPFMVHPSMQPQPIEPKTLQTKDGFVTMVNPTNAAPIVNIATGNPALGYAAEPADEGSIGFGGASPTGSPAPAPTPFPEGATIRSKSDGKLYKIVNGQPVLAQ